MRSASRASNSQQKTINNIVKYEQNCSVSFTGKERDRETGFSYFGARYYDSDLTGLFLSVDPMADKYPNLSPYAYCAWNPVKLVDPKGREIWIVSKAGARIKYENGMSVKPELV